MFPPKIFESYFILIQSSDILMIGSFQKKSIAFGTESGRLPPLPLPGGTTNCAAAGEQQGPWV